MRTTPKSATVDHRPRADAGVGHRGHGPRDHRARHRRYGPSPSGIEAKDSYLIGMSQANKGEPWRQAMNDQIAAAAEAHPELEVVFADAAQDNAQQVADVENFLSRGSTC